MDEFCEDKKVVFIDDRSYQPTYYALHSELLRDVKLNILKVHTPIFKEKGKSYIGISEGLNKGEVIKIGRLGIEYRVIRDAGFTKGNIRKYNIKRLDGFSITSFDTNNSPKGAKVIPTGRKSDKFYLRKLTEAYSGVPFNCEI